MTMLVASSEKRRTQRKQATAVILVELNHCNSLLAYKFTNILEAFRRGWLDLRPRLRRFRGFLFYRRNRWRRSGLGRARSVAGISTGIESGIPGGGGPAGQRRGLEFLHRDFHRERNRRRGHGTSGWRFRFFYRAPGCWPGRRRAGSAACGGSGLLFRRTRDSLVWPRAGLRNARDSAFLRGLRRRVRRVRRGRRLG